MVGDIGGTSGKNWGITSLDAPFHAAAGPKLTLKRGLGADFLLITFRHSLPENLTTDEHGFDGSINSAILIFPIRVIRGQSFANIFLLVPGPFSLQKWKRQRSLSAYH
jgi:hypothetical protein